MRFRRDWFDPFMSWLLVGLAALVGLAILVVLLGWQPPEDSTIATSREDGAYYAFAEEYRDRFAELGYTLTIRETAGGIETIELLNRGEVDAGFVQNTVSPGSASPELSTLAAIYYEALWVFYRDDLPIDPTSAAELAGLHINVGEVGSATNEDALDVLALNGITEANATVSTLPTSEAAQRLKDGELDAVMIFAGAASPLVVNLLETPGMRLLPFRRAAAYTGNFKNLAEVVLSEGAADLAQNIPPVDTPLIAARATLVAGPTLHPDLARLLLIIASDIHRPGGIFEQPNEFPSSTFVGIPMNPDAASFIINGATSLERYLPLWLASRLERYLFLLVPTLLILYSIMRALPSVFSQAIRRSIKYRYQRLYEIERGYLQIDRQQLDEAIAELERWQVDLTEKVNVPVSHMDEL
jgi:hypothetical protein